MNRYLVLLAFSYGMTDISNVGIVEAENETEARRKFLINMGFLDKGFGCVSAYKLDELKDGWVYFL